MFQGLRGEKDDLQGQGQWAGKQHMQQMKLLDTFSSHCFNLLLKKKKKVKLQHTPFPRTCSVISCTFALTAWFPRANTVSRTVSKNSWLGDLLLN